MGYDRSSTGSGEFRGRSRESTAQRGRLEEEDPLSCKTATACAAVGWYSPGGVLVERWNGTAWSIRGALRRSCLACLPVQPWVCSAVGWYTNASGTQVTLPDRHNG
jgi:hypothetical protein